MSLYYVEAGALKRFGGATVVTVPDTTAPTQPGALSFSSVASSGFTASWGASTDAVGVTSYVVTYTPTTGTVVTHTVTGLSDSLTGAATSTSYTVSVVAKDAAGNTSTARTGTQATGAAGSTTITHGSQIRAAVLNGTYTTLVGHRAYLDATLGRNVTDADLTVGDFSTTANGQTLSRRQGGINSWNHTNVTLRASWLTSQAALDFPTNAVFSYCEFGARSGHTGGQNPGYLLGYSDFTINRCDMHNCTDMVRAGVNVNLTESYLHEFLGHPADPDPHFDGVQTTSGNTVTIARNYIHLNQGQSAGIAVGGEQGATTNWNITDNYIKTDGAFCVDMGNVQTAGPVIVSGNIFDCPSGQEIYPTRPGQYRIIGNFYANGTPYPNSSNF